MNTDWSLCGLFFAFVQVYPGLRAGGVEADMMAANELNCHAFLQVRKTLYVILMLIKHPFQSSFVSSNAFRLLYSQFCPLTIQGETGRVCQNIQIFLGGFETKTGEQVKKWQFFTSFDVYILLSVSAIDAQIMSPLQWLAFRNDGIYSAADYAKIMGEDVLKYRTEGAERSWNPFDWEQKMKRRRKFVIKLLSGAMVGLAYMHSNERLHQSLGPASVVLKYISYQNLFYIDFYGLIFS